MNPGDPRELAQTFEQSYRDIYIMGKPQPRYSDRYTEADKEALNKFIEELRAEI